MIGTKSERRYGCLLLWRQVGTPEWVYRWRLEAEHAMRASGRPGMTDKQARPDYLFRPPCKAEVLVSNVCMHACMLLCCTRHSGHILECTNLTLVAAGTQDMHALND